MKITAVVMSLLIWGGTSRAYAEEELTSKSVGELLEIITHNHDNYATVKPAASELEKRTPTAEKDILRLMELVGETRGRIQQNFINAVSNIQDPVHAAIFIKEMENENPMRVAVGCGMSGKLKIKEAVSGIISVIERYGEIVEKADTGKERAVSAAVLALGEIRDERGLAVLTKYMGKLAGYDSQALAEFGARVMDILLKEIEKDRTSPAGRSAIWAISMMTDPKVVPELNRIIGQKAHPARKSAIVAMFNIDRKAATEYLLKMWEKGKDSFLERQLLLHINRKRLKDRSLCPFLIHVLNKSHSIYARKGSALALGRIGGTDAVKALKKAAVYDKDPFVRVYANQALKMAEDPLTGD